MEILVWIIGILMVLVGLFGVLLPALPGAPLVFLGLFSIAWIGHFQRVGWETLLLLGFLTVLSFVVDFATVSYGAKRFGATRLAAWGAAAGMLVAIFFGIPGLIFGPFLGAFLGELMSIGDLKQAARAGFGSWVGLILGVTLKMALTFMMIGVFIVSFFS